MRHCIRWTGEKLGAGWKSANETVDDKADDEENGNTDRHIDEF